MKEWKGTYNKKNAVVAVYCHGFSGDVPALIAPPL